MTLNGWQDLQCYQSNVHCQVWFDLSNTVRVCGRAEGKEVEESFGSAYFYQMFTALQILHHPLFHMLVMLTSLSLSHSWPCRKQWSLLFFEFLFTLFPSECPCIFLFYHINMSDPQGLWCTIILEHSERICFYPFTVVITVSVGPISSYNVLMTLWNFQKPWKPLLMIKLTIKSRKRNFKPFKTGNRENLTKCWYVKKI